MGQALSERVTSEACRDQDQAAGERITSNCGERHSGIQEANTPLQPRSPMITPAIVGCKRMLAGPSTPRASLAVARCQHCRPNGG